MIGLVLLLPLLTPTIWFSLDHKRNVNDGVVSGVGTLFSLDHKLYASDYDSDSDSVASENQPLVRGQLYGRFRVQLPGVKSNIPAKEHTDGESLGGRGCGGEISAPSASDLLVEVKSRFTATSLIRKLCMVPSVSLSTGFDCTVACYQR